MHSGKLWTPEGIPIAPEDGGWWSLLVRQARCFRTLYQRSADFERALMMLTAKGLAASDAPGSLPSPGVPALAGSQGAAAQPPLNLLKEHISTSRSKSSTRMEAVHG
jgi:hypothetical protein